MSARPRVTLKLATSLDGRIATAEGQSQWITGTLARAQVHEMRLAHDGVGVGIATALADDPLLTARTDPAPLAQPMRVVFDTHLRLPHTAQLVQTREQGRVCIITGKGCGQPEQIEALRHLGVEVLEVARRGPHLDLREALALLRDGGLTSLMIEGGGQLAAALVGEALVDRLEWFRASLLLGAMGRPALGPLSAPDLAEFPRARRIQLRELGPDLWETYVFDHATA